MATPVIGSIAPQKGHSGGRNVIAITGSGFQIPPATPDGVPVPKPAATVRVLFGDVEAIKVEVAGEDLLYVVTPIHDVGVVDVVVENIDVDGVLIPGESTTIAAAYEFALPDLNVETDLARVIRTFIRELKRQIIPNVSLSTHTDYDEETGDVLSIAQLASVPALVIANLELQENTELGVELDTEIQVDSERFVRRRAADFYDVVMTLAGATNNQIQLLNLIHTVRGFFRKNAYLEVPRYANSAEKIRYVLQYSMNAPISTTAQMDGSNLATFAFDVRIVGVRQEAMIGLGSTFVDLPEYHDHDDLLEYGWIAEVVNMSTQSK